MKTIKTKPPSKTATREFTALVQSMIEAMGSQYRNQSLLALNKGDQAKFTDAKAGNFGKVWLGLANKTERKLRKRFSDKLIQQRVTAALDKSDRQSKANLYASIEREIGVDSAALIAAEGLTANRNALILETGQWLKRLRDETLETWTASTLRQMAEGKGIGEIMQQFDGMVEERKNHAKFVAVTQINSFNGLMTKMRGQKLGIERAIWRTSGDERVRPCHHVRNGKEYLLSEGLYSSCDKKTLQAGVDYFCRCTAELVLDD